jgi:hypothetical protein
MAIINTTLYIPNASSTWGWNEPTVNKSATLGRDLVAERIDGLSCLFFVSASHPRDAPCFPRTHVRTQDAHSPGVTAGDRFVVSSLSVVGVRAR